MLRLALPVILLSLGVAGGVGVGMVLGTDSDAVEQQVAEPDAGNAQDQEQTLEAGSPPEPVSDGSTEFVRLNNQFIVPIVRHGSVRSLVVMSLTLEVENGENGAVFEQEPRLRDAFLRAMFAHANAGGFDGSFTESTAMAPLREALREAATGVLGASVRDVLIVDITRQDA